MMKTIKILTLLLTLNFLFSCDEIERNRQEDNYVTPYKGKWVGTYTGDQSGTLVLNVGEKGGIEGVRKSMEFEETFYTSMQGGGSGAISTMSPSPSGFLLYGSLETKSGTWKMGALQGKWTVVQN
ncbi:hypothetical protein [Chryseobacterium sp.]|uniref:hypothetical protein n=1 Tax=Chryseobacterium sp. TaxID=1871047 RepID=UPI00289D39B0|nr:hypothetical protein [Chryseobacterium sp.]